MNVFRPFGSGTPPHDPAALARSILAQPRFRVRVQAPAARTWWDVLRQWLGDRWNQMLDAFAHHVRVGRGTSAALGDVLIAVTIAVVVFAAIRLLLTMTRQSAGARAHSVSLPHHADASELHAAAKQAAKDGFHAIAVALIFRAALAALDARGALRDDPARTVNECRGDVQARAAHLSASFDVIAKAFTAAVYAEDRVTLAQWADAERAYERVALPQDDAA